MIKMTDEWWAELRERAASRYGWIRDEVREVTMELDRSRMSEEGWVPPPKKALPTSRQHELRPKNDRGTGKTTKLIHAAIDYALAGRSVVFVGFSHHSTQHAYQIYKQRCEEAYITQTLPIQFMAASVVRRRPDVKANVLILDDTYLYLASDVDFIKCSVPSWEKGHDHGPVVCTYLGGLSERHTKKMIPAPLQKRVGVETSTTPPVCECGSAKAKLPTHSSWCPVGGK